MYGAFQDRLKTHKNEIRGFPNKTLKWQLRVLSAVLEGRSITFRVGTLLFPYRAQYLTFGIFRLRLNC